VAALHDAADRQGGCAARNLLRICRYLQLLGQRAPKGLLRRSRPGPFRHAQALRVRPREAQNAGSAAPSNSPRLAFRSPPTQSATATATT
jgi:hypothetical protein